MVKGETRGKEGQGERIKLQFLIGEMFVFPGTAILCR